MDGVFPDTGEGDWEILTKLAELNKAISSATLFRSWCLTREGYVGLMPQESRETDLIYILEGARTPFVLRRMEGSEDYMLVGEAYVHGLMHGEASQRNNFGFARLSLI